MAAGSQALSASLRQLSQGQIGWITVDEARRLFSLDSDNATALTMFDSSGLLALGNFAAAARHRSRPLRTNGRVQFTRL
jgi:hypothetical protein